MKILYKNYVSYFILMWVFIYMDLNLSHISYLYYMCLSHMPYIDLVFCSSCMVPDHTSPVVHVANLSLVLTRMKHAPTPRRSVDDQRQTGLIVGLDHIILHPSRQPWSRGERIRSSSYIATSACWFHNTSMRSIRSMLTHGGQLIGP
jgi:hypothetical protein